MTTLSGQATDAFATLITDIAHSFPHLEVSDKRSEFEETSIEIGGIEEETILVMCDGSRDIAERLVRIVNGHAELVQALVAATHALRSYEHGNAATALAASVADHCAATLTKVCGQ